MRNNEACNIPGIRSVTMKLKDETVKLLRNVRHVPHLKRANFIRNARFFRV